MQKVCAKLIPKLLTDEQKANRVLIASEFLEHVEIEPDFIWISLSPGTKCGHSEYDPEMKRQNAERHISA